MLLAACGSGGGAQDDGAASGDEGPPTIVFAGDSVMRELSAAVIDALDGHAEASYVGLPTVAGNEPAVGEWQERMAEHPPDLVVIQVGTWEVNAAPYVPYGLVGYGDSLEPFLDVVATETDVLWLGHPALQSTVEDEVLDQLIATWEALPQAYTNVEFLDAGAAVEPAGAFQTLYPLPDGRQVLTRQLDGRHLCPDGVVLQGRAVLAELAERFEFEVTDEWESGPWREDPAVFENPELCPADLGDPLLG